jgi:hypothetical protein
MTRLVFYVRQGVLEGQVRGHTVRVSASSGGRGGSKLGAVVVNQVLKNNPGGMFVKNIGHPGFPSYKTGGSLPEGIQSAHQPTSPASDMRRS